MKVLKIVEEDARSGTGIALFLQTHESTQNIMMMTALNHENILPINHAFAVENDLSKGVAFTMNLSWVGDLSQTI